MPVSRDKVLAFGRRAARSGFFQTFPVCGSIVFVVVIWAIRRQLIDSMIHSDHLFSWSVLTGVLLLTLAVVISVLQALIAAGVSATVVGITKKLLIRRAAHLTERSRSEDNPPDKT